VKVPETWLCRPKASRVGRWDSWTDHLQDTRCDSAPGHDIIRSTPEEHVMDVIEQYTEMYRREAERLADKAED
jgi:hypothetical protein